MKTNGNGVLIKLIGAIFGSLLGMLVLFNAWTGQNIVEMREGLGRVEVKIEQLCKDVDRIDARRHSD